MVWYGSIHGWMCLCCFVNIDGCTCMVGRSMGGCAHALSTSMSVRAWWVDPWMDVPMLCQHRWVYVHACMHARVRAALSTSMHVHMHVAISPAPLPLAWTADEAGGKATARGASTTSGASRRSWLRFCMSTRACVFLTLFVVSYEGRKKGRKGSWLLVA